MGERDSEVGRKREESILDVSDELLEERLVQSQQLGQLLLLGRFQVRTGQCRNYVAGFQSGDDEIYQVDDEEDDDGCDYSSTQVWCLELRRKAGRPLSEHGYIFQDLFFST